MSDARTFIAVSAVLLAISTAVSVVCCASISAMGGMPMPGGWTMSMAWMRMPGQSWPGGASGASRSWSSRTDRRFSAVHSLETASSRVARIIGAIIVTTGLLIIAVTLLPALRA